MFDDRKDAGIKLARALGKYKDENVIVLGIPRGGVEIAYYIALHLNAAFSMIMTRKLGYPESPEAAFGAIAEDGSVYLSEEAEGSVTDDEIRQAVATERAEIERRIVMLRNGNPLPDVTGRTVIIADDGIATGATVLTAVAMCRKRNPSKVVVAAPIATQWMMTQLRKVADEVVILEKPEYFYAVGQAYKHFENLTDEETQRFVEIWNNRLKNAS
ncbi:MAG TPA: phosphoribosyltransferase family protein [Chryseosolibacter sp.]